MSIDKRWTYKQLTEMAEREIDRALQMADDASPIAADLHRCAARGVYDMWYNLTVGWQDDGDSKRLNDRIEFHRAQERETTNRS
jgi:hypothetical protein